MTQYIDSRHRILCPDLKQGAIPDFFDDQPSVEDEKMLPENKLYAVLLQFVFR